MAFFSRSAAAARHVIIALTLSVASVVGLGSAHAQTDWNITKIDGREYVSVENVKKFYEFHTATREGNTITLSNVTTDPKTKVRKGAVMKLQIGSQECLLNNVKFIFTYSVEAGVPWGWSPGWIWRS